MGREAGASGRGGPAPGTSAEPYAFAGQVIRLNHADFERWQAKFSAIPDLTAKLVDLDGWISKQPEADLHNAAVVEDVLAKQYYPAAAKITGEFYGKSGGDALPAYPNAVKDLQSLSDDIRGSLDNPDQQRAFQGFVTKRLGADIKAMSHHAATEGKTFQRQANDALIGAQISGGVQNWTDPGYVDRSASAATCATWR